MQSCSIINCCAKTYSLGWCRCHYERHRRHGDPNKKSKDPDIERYLLARIMKKEGCWVWCGSICKGYGNACFSCKHVYAHVLSAIHFLKYKKESGLFVLHKCDNRACVNPAHLFLGTLKDNHIDMVNKNRARFARGEKINTARLKENDVKNIKKLLKIGVKRKEIAKKYMVVPSTIDKIACGKNWRWV